MTHLVAIPVLDAAILANRPEVVAVLLERHLHDALIMGKDRLVTISKVKTPDLDVFVGRASGDQLGIGGDVKGENRKFVTVEGKEEFQRVLEEDLDS